MTRLLDVVLDLLFALTIIVLMGMIAALGVL